MTSSSGAPSPRDAYAQWVTACTDAGWQAGPVAEQVPVQAALGRVTAAAVRARWPSPRFACAAMDGIAVAAFAAEPADDGEAVLPAPAFTWVDTGDLLPAGTDTVVERERVAELRADGTAVISGALVSGKNVRAIGEDFQAGQLLVPAGRRLRPADLGAAATAGYAALAVTRQPVVAIIPTGDEIRPVGAVLGPGEFTDSNSVMLAALAAQAGAVPHVTDVQPDEPDVLAAAVRGAARVADLVLVLAGSSHGRGDYTAAVMDQVGGLTVHGVAVRPGHPVLLGHLKPGQSRYRPPGAGGSGGAVPAIGIPGYPLAAVVIFELFAAPLLARLRGSLAADRALWRARLGCDWASPPDVEDWVPVSLHAAPDRTVLAVPDNSHGAGSVSRLVRADAWWPIPIGHGQFTEGEHIEVLPMDTAPESCLPAFSPARAEQWVMEVTDKLDAIHDDPVADAVVQTILAAGIGSLIRG